MTYRISAVFKDFNSSQESTNVRFIYGAEVQDSSENYFKLSNAKIFSAIKSGDFYFIDCKQCAL